MSSLTLRTGFLLLAMALPCMPAAAAESEPDASVQPGARFEVPFPDLPQTLAEQPSAMRIYIPKDYTANRKFPLFVWLSGTRGIPACDLSVVGESGFSVVGLPLYKVHPGQTTLSIVINQEDAQMIWTAHRKMLAELDKIVPNIDRDKRIVAGFSNGAHTIAVLINLTHEFTDYFQAFVIWEGGIWLDRSSGLKSKPVLIVHGQNSELRFFLPGLLAKARSSGADVESIQMDKTGHKKNTDYCPKVRDWIDRKILATQPAGTSTNKAPES